ncbi:MAG TPA: DUF938 domain-containing protein [Polyangiaceae bacterium]|nr:DUF938 domain-containing protein [Polyangiaceae bacterium]
MRFIATPVNRTMTKQVWAPPERNKLPIFEVLERVLPASGTLLELASGTGQHAAYFASRLPTITFLPSDVDAANLSSIAAFVEEAALPNLRAPRFIDVCALAWDAPPVEAIFNANMIHITPWECTEGLFRGAARHLAPGGVLVMYGPYRIHGAHTAESNAVFDAEMQKRDSRFGVRDLEVVAELAQTMGIDFVERVPMPANNQTLVFRRRSVD